MANVLKMADRQAIVTLRERGWSLRRISRELGVHRDTVSKYVREAAGAKQATPTPGNSGPESECEPFRDVIEGKLGQGLSGRRIWQDLTYEHGFTAGYESVKRFVRRLRGKRPLPFRRMECEPGAEAQVDISARARRSARQASVVAPRVCSGSC